MKNKAIELFDFDGSYLGKLATRCETSTAVISKAINSGQLRQAPGAGIRQIGFLAADLDRIRDTQPRRVLENVKSMSAQLSATIDRLKSTKGTPPRTVLRGVDRMSFAAATVDRVKRVIVGACVGVAGVEAVGKFVYRLRDGSLSSEPDGAVEKLQVVTDQKFLETLLASVQDAGGRLRVRVDHNDEIAARVGYAENFRRDGDCVRCDLTVLQNSEPGELVLECARLDPRNIGLSVDIKPVFEIVGGRAAMRVTAIRAVDVVDRGAITPRGL